MGTISMAFIRICAGGLATHRSKEIRRMVGLSDVAENDLTNSTIDTLSGRPVSRAIVGYGRGNVFPSIS